MTPLDDATTRNQPKSSRKIVAENRDVLLLFRHGLGDAVQFTVVLQHLQRQRPGWNVDVAALTGKHSAFVGLARSVLTLDGGRVDRSGYDQVYRLEWHECSQAMGHAPSTKATRCLDEVFGIEADPLLCRYAIQPSVDAERAARGYLAAICHQEVPDSERYPAVLIHYQGNTSAESKDLPHELVRELCDDLRRLRMTPVILDWDRRCPFIDNVHIHNPGADHSLWAGRGTGDAQMIASLIEASSLMIGIDSGPLHVAGATSTPTIGVWTEHHPVHYFDLADNVLHLVPLDHEERVAGRAALEFFQQHYRRRNYRSLHVELPAVVESRLTGQDVEQLVNRRFLRRLRARSYNARYYDEHKRAGLDYLGHGEWQAEYGEWLVECLSWNEKPVLDVGCACGSILRGMSLSGAVMQGIDLNEHMIQLGRQTWPELTDRLSICDAVNLHLFEDGSFKGLHSAQVAEHWKAELVPAILRELLRVSAPGGLFFCSLDTTELFARQERSLEQEDPTHVCVRPRSWWQEQFALSGWLDVTDQFATRLAHHPKSFLTRYDWEWFVVRRPS